MTQFSEIDSSCNVEQQLSLDPIHGISRQICGFCIWCLESQMTGRSQNQIKSTYKCQCIWYHAMSWVGHPPMASCHNPNPNPSPMCGTRAMLCVLLAHGLMKVLFACVWSAVINWQWASTVNQWFTMAMKTTVIQKSQESDALLGDAAIPVQWSGVNAFVS